MEAAADMDSKVSTNLQPHISPDGEIRSAAADMASKTSPEPVMVRCLSCGAQFKHTEPKCPYCGTIYVPGAETAYMNHLDDIRDEMEDLNDLALSGTGAEFKRVLKKTGIALIIVIAAIAGLFALAFVIDLLMVMF